MFKSKTKKELHMCVICFLLLFSIPVLPTWGQQMKLLGVVTGPEGEPLPGAVIQVQGKGEATITDVDGHYSLRTSLFRGDKLVVSFLGMAKQVLTFKGEKRLNVKMKYKYSQLQGVEVRARQNVNEIDLRGKSGVVALVDMGKINNKPTIDIATALQGAVPGLTVVNTGELGSKPKIRIRGNASLRSGDTANEPLYVLDGKVITSDVFYDLNPLDIKEIKVLKDAVSCALYGIKAANGVIEITSKRGTTGATLVSTTIETGVTFKGRRGVEMMNSTDKLELERRLRNTSTPGYAYSEDYYRRYFEHDARLDQMIAEGKLKLDSLRTINTDWYNELLRTNLYQKYNVSLRGGSKENSYYTSFNYSKQGGRIQGNDRQRMSVRLNLDKKIGEWGYLMFSADGGYSRSNTPNGTKHSPMSLIYELNPYEQPNKGVLYAYPNRTFQDLLNQYRSTSEQKTTSFSTSLTLNPLPGLDIAAVLGANYDLGETKSHTPSTAYDEVHSGVPEKERGILSKRKSTSTSVTSNVRITYNKVLAEKHDLTFSFNSDYYFNQTDYVSMKGYGVGILDIPSAINQSIEGNRKPKVGSERVKTAQLGFGGAIGYSYKSLFDVFASYKLDASSLLPRDKRWNAAWAIGAGLNLSQFPGYPEQAWIQNLNIKASYGHIASLAGVSASSTVATFTYPGTYYDDQRQLSLINYYNTDLKPEQTHSLDIGLSFDLTKYFSFQFGVYKRRTVDALLDVPIPSSNGFTSLKRNIGVLDNDGLECSVRAKVLETSDCYLSLRASIAYNRNKVVDLYYGDRIYTNPNNLIPDYEVGQSYDMIYGPVSLGINPVTGLPTFKLSNGTEGDAYTSLKRKDMVALGHSTPPYSGLIGLNFSWHQLDIMADFYYVLGGKKAYNYTYVRNQDNVNKNAVANQLHDMWFKIGDSGKKYYTPFYTSGAINNLTQYPNSKTVGRTDYLRLSMLSLRYRFTRPFLKRYLPLFQYVNVALQASNLFMITAYDQSNPEMGNLAGMQQPVLTLNLNVTF